MYKQNLVATDLDGTLLDGDRKLSNEAVKAFEDLNELDVITSVITSRPDRFTKDIAHKLGCNAYACNNGAEIYRNGELFYKSHLSDDFVREFTEKLMYHFPDMMIGAEAGGRFYANYNMLSFWDKEVPERCDFPKFPFTSASKLIIKAENSSDLATVSSFIDASDVHLELAHQVIILTTSEATKGKALSRIAASYGIDKENTFVFGDDIGDLEMMRISGHPFCVENGHPMLKEEAVVIPSNTLGGVVTAIKKYIIGG